MRLDDLQTPPGDKVKWTTWVDNGKSNNLRPTVVMAQTWFEARNMGAKHFGVPIDKIVAKLTANIA